MLPPAATWAFVHISAVASRRGHCPLTLPLRLPYQLPLLLISHDSAGPLDAQRTGKLDMEQHLKWIVYGSDGLGGRGRTRMRPEVAPCHNPPALGHALRITGFMAYFVINLEGCVVPHR